MLALHLRMHQRSFLMILVRRSSAWPMTQREQEVGSQPAIIIDDVEVADK